MGEDLTVEWLKSHTSAQGVQTDTKKVLPGGLGGADLEAKLGRGTHTPLDKTLKALISCEPMPTSI